MRSRKFARDCARIERANRRDPVVETVPRIVPAFSNRSVPRRSFKFAMCFADRDDAQSIQREIGLRLGFVSAPVHALGGSGSTFFTPSNRSSTWTILSDVLALLFCVASPAPAPSVWANGVMRGDG